MPSRPIFSARQSASSLLLPALLAGSLMAGCGGSPPPTPSPTPTVKATAKATPTGTPSASGTGTPSPGGTGTPGQATGTDTPSPDADYSKLREAGITLALSRNYDDAVPALQKALDVKPDDAEVHFYMMLSLGNKEQTPSPKSEAYAHAKKVLELAPDKNMASRARDYVNSADSEAVTSQPDLDDQSPMGGSGWVFPKKNAAYSLPVKAFMLKLENATLSPDDQKELWFLEVVPDAVDAKIPLEKGTQFTIRSTQDFRYSKTQWRGGKPLEGDNLDTNVFLIGAFLIEVQSGPYKGTRGALVNQMDHFRGRDDDGKPVWGVKSGPRLPVPRG